jgi:diaminohydroxyphosphoribosylaminopyrimidine deaminase/5-amino-6-(5-phosphoribosylamino)uracil reductase
MVGCVVVRDGVVVGEGYHAKAGEPHAEVNAVRAAGGDITGATLYVSLEPCAHQGRAAPCTELLLRSRPKRVVVAMEDPNPKVAGKGIAVLREAGIAVDVGVLEAQARRLNEWYVTYMTRRRPFVIAKCAMTLDGKIATRTGASQWITGAEARARVHELRSQVDAILVGRRTLDLDDPSLTARTGAPALKQPVRIVLTKGLDLDPARKLFTQRDAGPTWIAAPAGRAEGMAAEVVPTQTDGHGNVDMAALMRELGRREVVSLMVEGGGETLAATFAADVVDKVMWFVAPKIIGGRDAITAVEGEGAARLDEAISLERMEVQSLGDDLLIEAYVKRSADK